MTRVYIPVVSKLPKNTSPFALVQFKQSRSKMVIPSPKSRRESRLLETTEVSNVLLSLPTRIFSCLSGLPTVSDPTSSAVEVIY